MTTVETIIVALNKDKTTYDLVDLEALIEFLAEHKSHNAVDGLRSLVMALVGYADDQIGLDKESVLKLVNDSWDSKKEYDKEVNHGNQE